MQGDSNSPPKVVPLSGSNETREIVNAAGAKEAASEKASPIQPRRSVKKLWFAAAAVGIATALIFGLYFGRDGRFRANAAPRIQSVAVLPLENLSGDSSQEYFTDGMTAPV